MNSHTPPTQPSSAQVSYGDSFVCVFLLECTTTISRQKFNGSLHRTFQPRLEMSDDIPLTVPKKALCQAATYSQKCHGRQRLKNPLRKRAQVVLVKRTKKRRKEPVGARERCRLSVAVTLYIVEGKERPTEWFTHGRDERYSSS